MAGQALGITAVLVALLLVHVPQPGLVLRLWIVALSAIGIAALAEHALAGRTVGDGPGRRLRWGWWRRPRPERVRALEELEHAVDFALGTAFDVHYRLRPHLRRIAAHRLTAHGVSLDAQPDRARAVLGAEAWELVRPDRPEPEERNGRGLEPAQLRRIVERLDAL